MKMMNQRLNQQRFDSMRIIEKKVPKWKSLFQSKPLNFADLWRSYSRGFKNWQRSLNLRRSRSQQFSDGNFSDSEDEEEDWNHNMTIKTKPPEVQSIKFKNKLMEIPEVEENVETSKIRSIALMSRFLLLILHVIGKSLPSHDNDGFRFVPADAQNDTIVDHAIKFAFEGFTNWDGQYFLHVTTNGYTHMNTVAFFPLFPLLMSIPSQLLHSVLSPVVSFSSLAILCGWLFNAWLFQSAAVLLNQITIKINNTRDSYLEKAVTLLFCYNPASVFFVSYYSETLFSFLTMKTIYHLCNNDANRAIIFASLSTVCRSNGLLNFGFIAFYVFQRFLQFIRANNYFTYHHVLQLIKLTLLTLAGLVPFVVFQVYCVYKFCDVLGEGPFCGYQLPYSFIQKNNWDVGFLAYFQMKQIPNFLLASPILCVLGYESYLRFRINFHQVWKLRNFNYLFELFCNLHGLFLTAFCFLFMHVQVSTRLILAACPYLFIYIGQRISIEVTSFREKKIDWTMYSFAIHCWCLLYFIIGTLAFTRGYPWT